MVNIKINQQLLTVPQVASLLGISRIAVFKRIKKGQLIAQKYGRNYLVSKHELPDIFSTTLSDAGKKEIEQGVTRTIKEYGETLRLLGRE